MPLKDLLSPEKVFAFVLCFVLCAGLCSCKNGEEATDSDSIGQIETVTMTAAYSKEDGLNPFTLTSTLNKQLISLMYRGLYYLDNRYNPIPDIATDSAVTGTSLEVAIGDVKFSDGSQVSADDIFYSFYKAKDSSLYKELLSEIESCTVKNDSAVVFTLSDRNVNALMSLTFPVVKKDTAEESTSVPTGCGCYKYNSGRLDRNIYYEGSCPVHFINLKSVLSDDAITSLVDSGDVDFYYTDTFGGDTLQCSSASTSVYINNLVYIGLNGSDGNLCVSKIRRAISLAIDRREIVQSALQGNARPAVVPFNTSWSVFSDCETAGQTNINADTSAAAELLADYGIGLKASTSKKVKTIELSVIYPESNAYMYAVASLVAEQLKKVNINVTVIPVASSEYLEVLSGGDYDMYLGEVKISDDMDISSLMSADGSACYGIRYYELSCDEYYTDYIQGDITIDEFLEVFLEEQPFIPLCYRNGKFFRSDRIVSVTDITENRIFGSMGSWTLSTAEEETGTDS